MLEEKGMDHWWSADDFVPPGSGLVKGRDTLDVWFDSGSAWTATGDSPIDVCLEGSDQHRGWFQSSLLTRVITTADPVVSRNLVTHGFVVDENGRKMSKSDGNGISPMEIVNDEVSGASKPHALTLSRVAAPTYSACGQRPLTTPKTSPLALAPLRKRPKRCVSYEAFYDSLSPMLHHLLRRPNTPWYVGRLDPGAHPCS
jgi:isoleucyl-tRNA synthetase